MPRLIRHLKPFDLIPGVLIRSNSYFSFVAGFCLFPLEGSAIELKFNVIFGKYDIKK